MTTFNIYANGIFWGCFEAATAEEAMQAAANEHGTVDVGQTQASTAGMVAIEASVEEEPPFGSCTNDHQ